MNVLWNTFQFYTQLNNNEKAIEKAEKEYRKYQVKTLSPVEKDYLEVIKVVEKKVAKKAKSKSI